MSLRMKARCCSIVRGTSAATRAACWPGCRPRYCVAGRVIPGSGPCFRCRRKTGRLRSSIVAAESEEQRSSSESPNGTLWNVVPSRSCRVRSTANMSGARKLKFQLTRSGSERCFQGSPARAKMRGERDTPALSARDPRHCCQGSAHDPLGPLGSVQEVSLDAEDRRQGVHIRDGVGAGRFRPVLTQNGSTSERRVEMSPPQVEADIEV